MEFEFPFPKITLGPAEILFIKSGEEGVIYYDDVVLLMKIYATPTM